MTQNGVVHCVFPLGSVRCFLRCGSRYGGDAAGRFAHGTTGTGRGGSTRARVVLSPKILGLVDPLLRILVVHRVGVSVALTFGRCVEKSFVHVEFGGGGV
jgi:hypothetical protein